jgi:hypothetical protein
MQIKKIENQPLLDIITWIKNELKTKDRVVMEVLNPDITTEHYRGYKAWINLAELLHCRVLTPTKISKSTIELIFEKLNQENSFHTATVQNREEKYGVDSKFFSINKNEEPTFLWAYHKALESVKIENRKNILNLGINKGDEFELIEQMVDREIFKEMNLVGIDHSASALDVAKSRFPNAIFYRHDINRLDELNLDKSDLIITIGTLQSPSINYKPFLMSLVQNYLTDNGALILGFPNSRWIDHELIYGAIPPNYSYSEMSLVFNDVIFAKKYLQQKKFRVTITGREYIFLTATKFQKR